MESQILNIGILLNKISFTKLLPVLGLFLVHFHICVLQNNFIELVDQFQNEYYLPKYPFTC